MVSLLSLFIFRTKCCKISVKQTDGNVVLRSSDRISSCKHSTFMKYKTGDAKIYV